MVGQVVKLDRGYPLVRLADGSATRCEHATDLVKEGGARAVIGDVVDLSYPDGHDRLIIEGIHPRRTQLVRKDPAERVQAQVLAANFDLVIIAQPVTELNSKRLERELVLAFETGARVAVALTKADLAQSESNIDAVCARVRALASDEVSVLAVSERDEASLDALRGLIGSGETAVLVGKSGVGKSSLVNMLVGQAVQETGAVRETDGKGRHTTVSREIVEIPGGGRIIDMPGVRGLGMWEADEGIGAAFPDIEERAAQCRFRDCSHGDEPDCAVRAAVETGELASERLASYRSLKQETDDARKRRVEAERKERSGRTASRRKAKQRKR